MSVCEPSEPLARFVSLLRADLIRIEQLLLWLVNKAIPQRQGRGRYTKDDTARRTHVRTCAIPNLRWGKVPKESDWAMLYMDPPRPANQASADFKNLMALVGAEPHRPTVSRLSADATLHTRLRGCTGRDCAGDGKTFEIRLRRIAPPTDSHTHTHTRPLPQYVQLGLLSDPPGVCLYYKVRTLKTGLVVYRCIRGTSALEGYHLHLRASRDPRARTASPRLQHAESMWFDWRWNVLATIEAGLMPAIGHELPLAA